METTNTEPWSGKQVEATLDETGIVELELPCGCKMVLKNIGTFSCNSHGYYDPLRTNSSVLS